MADGDPRPCELCEAARFTHWYHEDEVCWVADCDACDLPIVVWRQHGTDPSEAERRHMWDRLADAAETRFGGADWDLDPVMRQVPGHFHAHARDRAWFDRRLTARGSRYTGVGGDRVER